MRQPSRPGHVGGCTRTARAYSAPGGAGDQDAARGPRAPAGSRRRPARLRRRRPRGTRAARAARRAGAAAGRVPLRARTRRAAAPEALPSPRPAGLSARPAQVQQVGVHAVGRLRHQRVPLADEDVGHEVGVEQRPERLAADGGQRVLDVELLGAQAGADRAGRRAAGPAGSRQTLVTSRRRRPSARARTMRSSGTSRRLSRVTSAGVMPASMATLASAAALLAASQPSTSLPGSASA